MNIASKSIQRVLLACALALPLLAQAAIDSYRVRDGQGRQFNAEVVGNQLYLFENGGKQRVLAPDGKYTLEGDGSVRQVRNGMLLPAVVPPGAAQGFNPQPDPPGKPATVAPGAAQGFNPQPDPPGKQATQAPGISQ